MKPTVPSKQPAGFSLVVTISMMILLTVIAVGLLSLSSISVKSAGLTAAESRARSNARMALMIAVDRLQLEMGPDQRISANASIMSSSSSVANPHWMGVWDSWKAGRKSDGSPDIAGNDTLSFHTTVQGKTDSGLRPSYDPYRRDHFRSWIVSGTPTQQLDLLSGTSLNLATNRMPEGGASSITLVEMGTLGNSGSATDFVTVPLVNIADEPGATDNNGRYAFWVSDQSQKASVMDDSYLTNTDSSLGNADHLFRQQAPGSMGNRGIEGLQNVSNEDMLEIIPSYLSLDVIAGLNGSSTRPSHGFHDLTSESMMVLSDVREGGLKKDLSTLLERAIVPLAQESGVADIDDFMLYRFLSKDGLVGNTKPQEIVPIQDLAAYYQLYDGVSSYASATDPTRVSSNRGVQYSTSYLSNGPHLTSCDFGTVYNSPIYPREYTAQYRQPRIIKIQFLLTMFCVERTNWRSEANRTYPLSVLNSHELIFGITPALTLWNPTNLPVMMQMRSNPSLVTQLIRFNDTPLQIRVNKNNGAFVSNYTSISGLATSGGFGSGGNMFTLFWSGKSPVRLEPGEVKTMSLPFFGDLSTLKSAMGYNGHWNQAGNMQNFFFKTDAYFEGHEVKPGWDPQSFILMDSSASPNSPGTVVLGQPDMRDVVNGRLRFKATDTIQVDVGCAGNMPICSYVCNQNSYQDFSFANCPWDRYNYHMDSRAGAGSAWYQALFSKGMTGGATTMVCPARRGTSIISRSANADGWPFLQYSFLAGAETNENSNAGLSGGRKFATRPFLHATPLKASTSLDDNTGGALYNYGWTWSADLINDVYEAPVQVNATGQSYFGGGYTAESGTTHVIQQDIPVVPPISIGALSGARLGGFSVSDQLEMPYGNLVGQMAGPGEAGAHQEWTRAVGFGGLNPYVLQAIGNSYAHPLIPADKAYIFTSRTHNVADGPVNITFADHSYLANKALWDDYFFSSISPQPNALQIFNGATERDAKTVASDFFFNDKPLPNRRMRAYRNGLDESRLDDLYGAQYSLFQGGLADKIAAHLMVEGGFNINSTSVEAWKVLFKSLKGKAVAYLNATSSMSGGSPSVTSSHSGTPVGQLGMAGGAPYSGCPNDPRDSDQWTSWRELTDDEIDNLAVSMVEQVKLRGPFLSLSEFVNRRLDASNEDLSLKGALQAALDDYTKVPINREFWTSSSRKFSSSEISSINATFSKAAEGPVAFGSGAYVDQADILRNIGNQLTVRGDTFLVRAYGDSLDPNGKVEARAWCEAVIQRLPDYVDPIDNSIPGDIGDDPETKQAALQSATNRSFGRKMQIISFRWLNSSEV